MDEPPVAPVAAPPLKDMDPDRPPAALPVVALISPLLPFVADPDVKDSSPEIPFVPASTLRNRTDPLVLDVPEPDCKDTEPPVPAETNQEKPKSLKERTLSTLQWFSRMRRLSHDPNAVTQNDHCNAGTFCIDNDCDRCEPCPSGKYQDTNCLW